MLERKTCFTVILLWAVVLLGGCGTARQEIKVDNSFVLQPGAKIRVEDVANDTGQIPDVDVIGLFWNALEEVLKEEQLLWSPRSNSVPLTMEGHILKYKKGSALQRWVTPGLGSTILDVRVDLKNGDQVVTSVEAYRKIAIGDGLTIGAWKKIFTEVAKDIVQELKTKTGC